LGVATPGIGDLVSSLAGDLFHLSDEEIERLLERKEQLVTIAGRIPERLEHVERVKRYRARKATLEGKTTEELRYLLSNAFTRPQNEAYQLDSDQRVIEDLLQERGETI
jgi:hypothetical protein